VNEEKSPDLYFKNFKMGDLDKKSICDVLISFIENDDNNNVRIRNTLVHAYVNQLHLKIEKTIIVNKTFI
jgi:hypothetical protein